MSKKTKFSPLLVTASVVEPLRYFFSAYGDPAQFTWNADEKKRTVEIADVHDYNKIPLQERPRILVSRGTYNVSKVGLSDNLSEGLPFGMNRGLKENKHMLMYSGTATILIEARNKGTCEILTDMVTHFLAWSRAEICDTQDFKNFADGMIVSECAPTNDQDDTTFQTTVQIPYMKEEHWMIRDDGPSLKGYLLKVIPK